MFRIFAAASIAFSTAFPAWADITPDDIWNRFDKQYEMQGTTLTFEEKVVDGDITTYKTIHAVSITDETYGDMSIDWIEMRQVAADQIEIRISPKMSYEGEQVRLDGTPEQFNADVVMNNFLGIATGTPESFTLTFAADYQKLIVNDLVGDGDTFGSMTFVVRGTSGTAVYTEDGESLIEDIQSQSERFSFIFDFSEAHYSGRETNLHVMFDGNNLTANTFMDMTHGFDSISRLSDIPTITADFSIDASSLRFDIAETSDYGDPESFHSVTTIGDIVSELSLSPDNFSISSSANSIDLIIELDLVEISDVFEASLDSIGYRIGGTYDGNAAGYFGTNLTNLTISNNLWDMFDPDQIIPRDPIGYEFSSTIDVLLNAIPEDLQDLETVIEDVTKSLVMTVEKAFFTGAGMTIEATGDTSIDFETLDSITGMPLMSAGYHIDMKGVTDFIGSLLELDLIEADMAFGARTIVGMIGIRQPEGDHFVSDVTVNSNGEITVNGKPFDFPR